MFDLKLFEKRLRTAESKLKIEKCLFCLICITKKEFEKNKGCCEFCANKIKQGDLK